MKPMPNKQRDYVEGRKRIGTVHPSSCFVIGYNNATKK